MAGRRRERAGDASVVRITTAAAGRSEGLGHRQRRYLISMTVRAFCFLAAVVVAPSWWTWVFAAGAVILPYVAVVMANEPTHHRDGQELLHGYRRELNGPADT